MSFKLLDAGIDALRRVCIGRSALVAATICVATAPSPSFAETPDAYLEYVASTGKQYVDTGIRAKSGIRAEMGMMWTAGNWYYATFLGARTGDDNLLLCHAHNSYRWGCFYGTTSAFLEDISSIPTKEDNKYYEVASEYTADGRFSATINGVTATATPSKNGTAVGALDTGLNLYLFARNFKKADGTMTHDLPVNARCYYLKVWTNDVNGVYVLARDLKPCVKGNIPGLYDKVTGEILYSGTSTALEAGPETANTIPADATALEYVATTTSQHIDTGVRARSGIKSETGLMWVSSGNQVYLGARVSNGVQFMMCQQYGGNFMRNYGTTSGNINNSESCGVSATLNAYHVVKVEGAFDGTYWKCTSDVDGTANTSGNNYKPGDTGTNLYLFRQNVKGANPNAPVGNGTRCYYLKIWETNGVSTTEHNLVRNFLPCKDPSGVVALYDTVSKDYFYPNTGTLTAGPAKDGTEVVWTGAAGTFALDTAANWNTGKVPTSDNIVTIPIAAGGTVFTTSGALALGVVKVIGDGSAAFPANVTMQKLDIAPYATAKLPGTAGLPAGGLTGAGALVLDPGAGNTITMTKANTDYAGEVVIASGTVKFGDSNSFGFGGTSSANGTARVRVRAGAKLDMVAGSLTSWTGRPSTGVVLEDGAQLVNSVQSGTDVDGQAPVSPLTIEGDTTIDNNGGRLNLGVRSYLGYDYANFNLGGNTLTLVGSGTTTVTVSLFNGAGTLDVAEGTTLQLRGGARNDGRQIFVTNGLLKVRSGANLIVAKGSNVTTATVKNLLLDGTAMVNASQTLKVTGFLTGTGTVNRVTLGAGAVFKPTGTGYLTITEALSGTMTIDLSGLDLSGNSAIPLFKTGAAAMLPAENEIVFAAGVDKGGWKLRKTRDGLGYNLTRAGCTIMIR